MQPEHAYLLGRACTDVRQAGRLLGKRLPREERCVAWFALGFWGIRERGKKLEKAALDAVCEQLAYLAYEQPDMPVGQAWTEWLLYAPVNEIRRQS